MTNSILSAVNGRFIVALFLAAASSGCGPAEHSAAPPDAPAAKPSTPNQSQSATARDPSLDRTSRDEPVGETENTPTVSPEQLAAAKQLAEDLGVVLQQDNLGNVIGLDTAARRSWVDDVQMQEMLVFPELQSLTVEGPSISHLLAPQIARATKLKSLAMRNTLITNEGIAELKHLKSLKIIDLRVSPLLDDAAMISLAEMPQLRAVRLNAVNVTDKGVATLLKLPQLTELDVRNCRGVTQNGIEQLIEKKTLRTLKIGGSTINDQVLEIVARMPNLTSLSLDNCDITDAGVAVLGNLPLVDLTLYQCANISDQGLHILASMSQLQRLTLRDVAANGTALAELPHPEKLVALNMAQSGITDAEVTLLDTMSGLEELTLSETALTDAAVDTLTRLTSLKKLIMTQTGVTPAGFQRLAQAIPKCSIRSN